MKSFANSLSTNRGRGWIAAGVAGSVFALAPAAHAALIDVQWNAGVTPMVGNAATGSTNTGSGSTAATTDQWNQLTSSVESNLALTDVTGSSTGVTLSVHDPIYDPNLGLYTPGASGYVNSPTNSTQSPFFANVQSLYASYEHVGGGETTNEIQLTFNGLTAGNYNLYLYEGADSGGQGRTDVVSADGGTQSTMGPTTGVQTMTSGLNYTELNVTVTGTGMLTVDVFRGDGVSGDLTHQATGEADLNGLQLQSASAPVPEPASLGLLSVSLLGLIARRRK